MALRNTKVVVRMITTTAYRKEPGRNETRSQRVEPALAGQAGWLAQDSEVKKILVDKYVRQLKHNYYLLRGFLQLIF